METPYAGLTPYQRSDAEYFFGREEERRVIALKLMAARMTLVYGPSGVGKSSLLAAGVDNDLVSRCEEEIKEGDRATPGYIPVLFSGPWRDDPTSALLVRVRERIHDILPDHEPSLPAKTGLVQELEAASLSLHSIILVMLDQFEDYFLYHPIEIKVGHFAAELVDAVTRPRLGVNFLVSLREDSLAKLDFLSGHIPDLYRNSYRVERLSRYKAEDAIRKPVFKYNEINRTCIGIEDVLVNKVLHELSCGAASARPGPAAGLVSGAGFPAPPGFEAPFLQLVMTRLWKESEGNPLGLQRETLDRLGGVPQIIRTHLDRMMSLLSLDERRTAAALFEHLVTPSGSKIAHRLSDLASYAALDQAQVAPLLNKLCTTDFRMLTPLPAALGEAEPRYQVSHDVLALSILDWLRRYRLEEAEITARREVASVRTFKAFFLGSYLLVAAALLPLMLILVWPGSMQGSIEARGLSVLSGLSMAARLLLIAGISGMLGSIILLATNFAEELGNRVLFVGGGWIYILEPLIGGALAVAVYFCLVTAFVNTTQGFLSLNPYGIGAASGFVGASARQAVAKLNEIFEHLFHRPGEPFSHTGGPARSS